MIRRCESCVYSAPGKAPDTDLYCLVNPPQVVFCGRDNRGAPILLSRNPTVHPLGRCACFTAKVASDAK